jgi:uncharacterized protein YybS (DUF2232 family)
MNMKDFWGCVGGTIFLLMLSTLLPFAGPFLALITPLIFLFYSIKLDRFSGLKLVVMTLAIVALCAYFLRLPHLIIFCLESMVLGVSLSECFRRNLSLGKTVFFTTLVTVSMVMVYFLVLGHLNNGGLVEIVRETLRNHIKASMELYSQGTMPKEKAEEFEAVVNNILMISPSLMVVGAGLTAWLNAALARPVFQLGKLPYPAFAPMDQWRTPEGLVWVLIASGFSLFLFTGGIQLIAGNVMIVLFVIYLFHGLSIVQFFLKKFNAPSWIRLGVYLLLVFQLIFLGLLALAGLFDQWVDFRRIQRRAER